MRSTSQQTQSNALNKRQLAAPRRFNSKALLPVVMGFVAMGLFFVWRSFASALPAYGYSVFACQGATEDVSTINATCATQSAEALVYRMYSAGPRRLPDEEGMTYWRDALMKGKTTPAKMVPSFFKSPKITQTTGVTNAAFITSMYATLLGKKPDAAGYNYWLAQLNSKKKSRDAITTFFANKAGMSFAQAKQKLAQNAPTLDNKQFVTELYPQLLGRQADANGLNYWTKQLDTKTKTYTELVATLATSEESRNYFKSSFLRYAATLTPPKEVQPVSKQASPKPSAPVNSQAFTVPSAETKAKSPNPHLCRKPYPTLRKGSKDTSARRTDKCVSAVQYNLKQAAPTIVVTGTIDDKTVVAIKNFQGLIKASKTGVLTPAQVQSIADFFGPYSTTSVPTRTGKINIAIVGAGFKDPASFKPWASKVIGQINAKQPFASNKANIVYRVASSSSALGCSFSSPVSRVLECSNTQVAKALASAHVPADKVIVIYNSRVYGGSAEAVSGKYAASSLAVVDADLVAHELGHLMGLMDEYTYTEEVFTQVYGGYSPDARYSQCVGKVPPASWRTTAGPWSVWKTLPGVTWYKGCTGPSWARPSQTSIMAGTSKTFNAVSVKIIQDTLNQYYKASRQ